MADKTRGGNAKSPIAAAVLSAILPGGGQIYAGELRRGLVFLFGLPIQAAIFSGLEMPWLYAGLAIVWLWNIYDAYFVASSREPGVAWPILLILALNIAAAWQVTDIQMPRLNEEQRSGLWGIASSLAKPQLFQSKTTEQTADAKYIVPGPGAPASISPVVRKQGEPYIKLNRISVPKGAEVSVNGEGFAPGVSGDLILLGADEQTLTSFRTDRDGRFETSFRNPRDIPGDYFVRAVVMAPQGGWVASDTLAEAIPKMIETVYLALMGTILSLIVALPLSFLGARNLMSGSPLLKSVYGATRGLFTVLRSVEVLIFAFMAATIVGVGPFAGVIALAIHGVGALGKLLSEAIESIEHGPIEAVRSTGANDLMVVTYAVVPQVVPQFIAFTLYRWDINVRMATVIGMVGGGGIGAKLMEHIGLGQWTSAATEIWLIAGVVMLMDYASAVIREKIA